MSAVNSCVYIRSTHIGVEVVIFKRQSSAGGDLLYMGLTTKMKTR